MSEPKMPDLVKDLVTFISRWPTQPGLWKRFRVAMTLEEKEAFKAFIKAEGCYPHFVLAIRNIPIEIDSHPTDPAYFLESFE
jgi:hypothetical protein